MPFRPDAPPPGPKSRPVLRGCFIVAGGILLALTVMLVIEMVRHNPMAVN